LGKSRLIEEFRARLGETLHTWVEWSSSQLLQNTPLHPVAEWGRLRFGGADAPDGRPLADLENTLQLVGLDPAEAMTRFLSFSAPPASIADASGRRRERAPPSPVEGRRGLLTRGILSER
jgi:hypothetical protein